MYTISIRFSRADVRVTHEDGIDRILYLIQEWIKQPGTRQITVLNDEGRQVFEYVL